MDCLACRPPSEECSVYRYTDKNSLSRGGSSLRCTMTQKNKVVTENSCQVAEKCLTYFRMCGFSGGICKSCLVEGAVYRKAAKILTGRTINSLRLEHLSARKEQASNDPRWEINRDREGTVTWSIYLVLSLDLYAGEVMPGQVWQHLTFMITRVYW